MQSVGVVGLGLLGRGIAACLLGHGLRVIGYAREATEHEEARRHIAEAIGELIDRAGFDPRLRREWPEHFVAATTYGVLADCDFVIESVSEDLAIKRSVYEQLEAVMGRSVPLASNTSALPITLLQECCQMPGRLLGMHWAEPAHATRFLELIAGEQTTSAALEAATELARQLGKEPCLVRRDVPGFVVNRLAYAMYREALHLLETQVADVETIDHAFRNACGLWAGLCGPFRWIDLTGGPALYARAMQGVLPTLNDDTELPRRLRELAEAEARGIANGRGFYSYTEAEGRHWAERLREHVWTACPNLIVTDPNAANTTTRSPQRQQGRPRAPKRKQETP
jgi:3-hydroxybutyryl-CoA dehydrogenase